MRRILVLILAGSLAASPWVQDLSRRRSGSGHRPRLGWQAPGILEPASLEARHETQPYCHG